MMYSEEKKEKDTDNASNDSFMGFYKKMPKRLEGTIRLFDRGDFYSAYGVDAEYVATEVFKTQTVLKQMTSKKLQMTLPFLSLNRISAQSFLREALTARQLKIEIWESEGGKKAQSFVLAKTASPGNLQPVEDLLFASSDILTAPISMAIKLSVKEGLLYVGSAYCDASCRELGLSEFVDNDLFSNVESLIIQLGVKECLIPSNDKGTDHDLTKLKTLIERCGIVVTEVKPSDFNTKDIEQDLDRLLKDGAIKQSSEFDMKIAMSSASVLINYLGLMGDAANFSQFTLKNHDLSHYMKLDASALRALSLFPSPGEVGGSKNMSLYGLLNHCKTAQGQRLLAQWLKQPLMTLHEIHSRQNLVEWFMNEVELRGTMREQIMTKMPDLHRLSKRFQRGVANLEDVVRTYQACLNIPKLLELIRQTQESVMDDSLKLLIEETYIKPFEEFSGSLNMLIEMVESTIDLDELANHNYVIKPEFDDDLKAYRRKLEVIRDGLDDEHQAVGDDLGLDLGKKLHMERHQTYGYCFRVTKAEAKSVSNNKKYHELSTLKSGTYFRTSTLRDLGDEYKEVQTAYDKKQSSLVKEVVGIAATYCPVLESLDNVLAHVDVLMDFAYVSDKSANPFVKPEVLEKGTSDMTLSEARHPCLEVQDGVDFIANDVTLKRDESEFLIVTGPNMGGKSTYIRQIGIIALMAQIGCYVPCTKATVPVFDCILSRVGAGDSQIKGISTFMAEMLETATILKSATRDSLIIIDELGRGTSTYDGFGLAWAISEYIAVELRSFCVFASHFHELTALSNQQTHVKNLHVVAHVEQENDQEDVSLLYKVEPGISDKSFGINVAQMAGFPESVIKLAKRKADELEDLEGHEEKKQKFSDDDINTGVNLVKEFMQSFAESVQETNEREALMKTYEQYKERIQESRWASYVIDSL
ncbi:DNA mismatch repair protein [Wallemia mellicola]|uniref:DNA mismatch repair protein MSH2 n=1 Tax=Wallemia mellicola TaxID=1708541 RepID=A0A4V4N1A5_9BASI|nr:DNA mismatch repair protein [Wallemia mellicola]TIC55973.1 DNA mismatch repair protein [Wallemia mellicola]